MSTSAVRVSLPALTLTLLVLGSTSALAAGNSGAVDAQARYLKERAVCMSGQSNQDRTTCLREAGAALNQARREGWSDASPQQALNERKRCERLPDEDRLACVARMQGQGTTSGSAAAGGIYRELKTIEVVLPSVAADAAVQSPPAK